MCESSHGLTTRWTTEASLLQVPECGMTFQLDYGSQTRLSRCWDRNLRRYCSTFWYVNALHNICAYDVSNRSAFKNLKNLSQIMSRATQIVTILHEITGAVDCCWSSQLEDFYTSLSALGLHQSLKQATKSSQHSDWKQVKVLINVFTQDKKNYDFNCQILALWLLLYLLFHKTNAICSCTVNRCPMYVWRTITAH